MRCTLTILLFFTGIYLIKAQTPHYIESSKLEIINNSSVSPDSVYYILINNAPVEPKYPNIPRFAIVGKNNKFYLSIGATVKATAAFDWGNPLNSPDAFITSNIKCLKDGDGSKIQMSLRRSKIHFSFVALPGTRNQFSTYISIKFSGNGNNYGAKLQNAYAKYMGLTVGYKNTLYSDDLAMPYTIDSQGPNSSAGITNTCINYEHTFSHNIAIGIGIENPRCNINETSNSLYKYPNRIISTDIIGKTSAVSQSIPDIPLYFQYKIKDKGHLRISGMLRNLEYRNLNSNKNDREFGWGIKISGKYKINKLNAYFMAQYGNGIASYIQDNDIGIDLVPDNNIAGKMQPTKSWGAYLGIRYNLNSKIFSSVIYSQMRNYMYKYDGGNVKFSDNYKWGQYVCANFIYSINSFVQCGIEYIYGRRMDFDKTQYHNNRIQTMFQITF